MDYRAHLVLAEQKAQEDYDKTVIALSGGALGISFAFIENFTDPETMVAGLLLLSAWFSWGLSLAAVLISYFVSQRALREAISQIDQGGPSAGDEIGGRWNRLTRISNAAGGLMFLLGLFLLGAFVTSNLGGSD